MTRVTAPRRKSHTAVRASRLIFTFLLCLLGLPVGQARQTGFDPVSDRLVWEYVTAEDPEEAAQLRRRILEHYAGDIQRVEHLIRAGPQYGPQPTGTLLNERIVIRDRPYQFSLHVPAAYRETVAYPLVVCLHGAGFSGDAYIERWRSRLDDRYILVCPSYPMGAWFTRRAEELVLAVVREVERRYHVDPDRVFLTGMSNGGIGAWLIGMHHAPLFAGIAPMASGLDEVLYPFLENLRSTPAYIIHGSHDQVMPVELSRQLNRALDHLGYPHVYREHDRVHPMAGGHFFPREELPSLVEWFDRQQRIPTPRSLTVVRDASHLGPFNWARIDATDRIASFSDDLVDKHDDDIRAKSYARLQVDISSPNHIDVRTDHVRQYTLFFDETLIDFTQPVRIVTNGILSFDGLVTPSLETLLTQLRLRRDPRRLFSIQLTLPVREQAS